MTLRNNIREVRLSRGMSQAKLAALVDASQPQIDRLEKGERKLSLEWLKRIAQALDVFPGALVPMDEYVADDSGDGVKKFSDKTEIRVQIPIRKTIQSASSMEFEVSLGVETTLAAPEGLNAILRGNQKSADDKILAFRAPNASLYPRWRESEIIYVSLAKNYNSEPEEVFTNINSDFFLIKMESGSFLLTRVLRKTKNKFRIYHDNGGGETKQYFIECAKIAAMYRLFDWEEIIYGWKREVYYIKLDDVVDAYNAK